MPSTLRFLFYDIQFEKKFFELPCLTLFLELSPSNRAGCQTKECKDNKAKIEKGSLRVGTWIDTERAQFWSWRHW